MALRTFSVTIEDNSEGGRVDMEGLCANIELLCRVYGTSTYCAIPRLMEWESEHVGATMEYLTKYWTLHGKVPDWVHKMKSDFEARRP